MNPATGAGLVRKDTESLPSLDWQEVPAWEVGEENSGISGAFCEQDRFGSSSYCYPRRHLLRLLRPQDAQTWL